MISPPLYSLLTRITLDRNYQTSNWPCVRLLELSLLLLYPVPFFNSLPSTHVHQHTTTDGYVNLENLAPNVPYVFCTNQAEQMLNVQTWRCIRYSTSLPFPEQFIEDIIVRNLQVISTGTSWAQIAWDVPKSTTFGRVIPRSYLIVLVTRHPSDCRAKILYVQAPWVSVTTGSFALFVKVWKWMVFNSMGIETCLSWSDGPHCF